VAGSGGARTGLPYPAAVCAATHRSRGLLLLFALWVAPTALADSFEDPASWVATIQPSTLLQTWLHEEVEALRADDPALAKQTIRVAIIDLPSEGAPQLADWHGDSPVYPASVPKFVYLMAAYAWRDEGRLTIDPELDRQLQQMIYVSSNRATQKVVARLTETEPGPRLAPDAYAEFRHKRLGVKRWLAHLGISDLHTVHPTYDGGGDLFGREVQFLEDESVEGSLPNQTGQYRNRQAMTAVATAKLLALLATDRALSPESSAEVRERMRRDIEKQRYLKSRIAGGAAKLRELEVFAKTGTWGPIYADAGIVRHPSGHQLIGAVFLEGSPRYRGSFIARLIERAVRRLFASE
jgi:beta-lactamase class A